MTDSPTPEEIKTALKAWLDNPDSALVGEWAQGTEPVTFTGCHGERVVFWPSYRIKPDPEGAPWSGMASAIKAVARGTIIVHALNRNGAPSTSAQIERVRKFYNDIGDI